MIRKYVEYIKEGKNWKQLKGFKVGEKVVYVDSDDEQYDSFNQQEYKECVLDYSATFDYARDELKKGNVYTVSWVSPLRTTIKLEEDSDGWCFCTLQFQKVDDEPEESNMEEWLEESLYDLEVGDLVVVKNNIINFPIKCFCKDKTGIIIGKSRDMFTTKFNVQFTQPVDTVDITERNGDIYTVKHFGIPKDHLVFLEDQGEENTGFEEWLEESKDYDFEKGDEVKIIKGRHKGKVGTVIVVIDFSRLDGTKVFAVKIDGIELPIRVMGSEIEYLPNYEEWVEESN